MLSALERVPQRSGTHEMLALPALREQIARVRTRPVWAWLGVALVVAAGVGLFLRHGVGDKDYFRVAEPDVVAMTESEATFALPAPLDPNGQPVAGDPAGALLRAAPVSNAERWVTEADEQIRRGRLGTPDRKSVV